MKVSEIHEDSQMSNPLKVRGMDAFPGIFQQAEEHWDALNFYMVWPHGGNRTDLWEWHLHVKFSQSL